MTIDYQFKSIDGLEGADNVSGIQQRIWLAPKSWFETIKAEKKIITDPTLGTAGAKLSDVVTIDGAHTFKAGKGFIELYTTQDTGAVGEGEEPNRDQNGKEITLTAFYPGDNPEVRGLLRVAKNHEWIVLYEDTNDREAADVPAGPAGANQIITTKRVFQIGTERLTADVRSAYNSNTLTGERKGHAITIRNFNVARFAYNAIIQLLPPPA